MCDIVIQNGRFGEWKTPCHCQDSKFPHSAGACAVTWAIPVPSCTDLWYEVLHVAGAYFCSISTRVHKYFFCKYTGLFVHSRKRKLILTWKSAFFLPAYDSLILLSIPENISTFWAQIDKKTDWSVEGISWHDIPIWNLTYRVVWRYRGSCKENLFPESRK